MIFLLYKYLNMLFSFDDKMNKLDKKNILNYSEDFFNLGKYSKNIQIYSIIFGLNLKIIILKN